MSQYHRSCPACSKNTLYITRSQPHRAFCVSCHMRGEQSETVIGAYYNFKDRPRTRQASCIDWHRWRPDLVKWNQWKAEDLQAQHV